MTSESNAPGPEAGRSSRLQGPFRAFAYPDYARFWVGSLLTVTSFFMMMLVRGQLMLELTNSPFMVSAIQGVSGLPILFLALVGGALADRVSRKFILVSTEAFNFVFVFALALLTLFDVVQVWHVFVLSLLNGVTFSLSMPSRNAVVANLVTRREDMPSGFALVTAVFSGAQLVGPALAGFLMASLGIGVAFLVPSILVFLATLLFVTIRPQQQSGGGPARAPMLQSIVEGFTWIRSRQVMMGLLLMGLAVSIFAMPWQTLLPVFADKLLSEPGAAGFMGLPADAHETLTPRFGLGLIAAAAGLGSIVASVVVAALGNSPYRSLLLSGGGIFLGVFIALFAFSPVFLLSLGLTLFLGFCLQLFMSTNITLMQVLAPDHIRGRVSSIRFVIMGLMPAGIFVMGVAAENVGPTPTVAAMGALGTLSMLVILAAIPGLRRV